MTREERTFARDLNNHISHFGPAAIVHKGVKPGQWWVRFQDRGFPCTFKTKRAAMEQAERWAAAQLDNMRRAGFNRWGNPA